MKKIADSAPRRPALVLVHGTRLTGAQWAGYADRLAAVADVRAPDLPGHGLRAHEPFTLAACADALDAAVRAADPAGKRPVFMAGHSLGGFAAMAYAERHPRRLAGLALIGSATEPASRLAVAYRVLARVWSAVGAARMERIDAAVFRRIAEPRVAAAIAREGEFYGAVAPAWRAVMAGSGSRQLAAVQCPVLVAGGAWDQLHLQARRFAAAAPHGEVHTQPRRTHLWPITHPQEVAALLARWIARIQAGGAAA